jgi:formiminoglutamase
MKSIHHNFEFVPKNEVLSTTGIKSRNGEHRNIDFLKQNTRESRFVILGISEWIGPFANYGRPGADKAFAAFLSFFLPLPNSNHSFDLLGNIVFIGAFPQEEVEASKLVKELDALVEDVLKHALKPHQTPIVIGGGHNNALPLLRWANVYRNVTHNINLDAHFDCRNPSRRHSGNAFSTAMLEGTLKRYSVLGVDSYAANEFIRNFVVEHQVSFVPLTDYLQGKSLKEDFLKLASSEFPAGLDIDLDCIENMPSSAQSPSGFTLNQVREVLLSLEKGSIAYVHLCEGAPTNAQEERTLGKALCFLVMDFISAME